MKRLVHVIIAVFVLGWTIIIPCSPCRADGVTAIMLALFGQYDADHNGVLSPQEQARTVDAVKSTYGPSWAARIQKMFARAASQNGSVTAEGWKKEVANYDRVPPTKNVRLPMSDGVLLATDIYLSRGDGPFPVILIRTPYGRTNEGHFAQGLVTGGSACVVQDIRGRFDSQGENLPFIGSGWGEHADGAETVAWLLKQPWCDGNIGTLGGSAQGITQNLLAGAGTRGLQAQYISVASASLYSDGVYLGGAFRKADTEGWLGQNKFDPRALELCKGHPEYDDYWRQFDTTLRFSQMNVPAVHIGGWFDMFAQGTIDEFVGRQHQGGPGSRGAQKLIIGPWVHDIGKMPAGDLTFPKAEGLPDEYNPAHWFGHYLGGMDDEVVKAPAVTYYVMGDTQNPGAPGNEWRHADDWPIPAKQTAYYFESSRKLSPQQPAESGAHVSYTFDPMNPCPTIGGNNLTIKNGPMNQNPIEQRGDVLLFTSEPLDKPLEVTGRVKAVIFISSSAPDTDLSVRLCDVYRDGKSYLVAEGVLRLRYRHSFEKPEPLTPGKVEEVIVDCWSTSIIFNKGHRIRATLTSSNYPRFDVNPGTGRPWTDSGSKLKQTNSILCDSSHASRLLLPVIPQP
jgi:predicted acyl esterase